MASATRTRPRFTSTLHARNAATSPQRRPVYASRHHRRLVHRANRAGPRRRQAHASGGFGAAVRAGLGRATRPNRRIRDALKYRKCPTSLENKHASLYWNAAETLERRAGRPGSPALLISEAGFLLQLRPAPCDALLAEPHDGSSTRPPSGYCDLRHRHVTPRLRPAVKRSEGRGQ